MHVKTTTLVEVGERENEGLDVVGLGWLHKRKVILLQRMIIIMLWYVKLVICDGYKFISTRLSYIVVTTRHCFSKRYTSG
jgi:hypothetical protein